jgi:hypothetical protein
MKLPIVSENVVNICHQCDSFKGINGVVEPLKDILEIECRSSGLDDDTNCKACTGTLNHVCLKYGSNVALILSRWYST